MKKKKNINIVFLIRRENKLGYKDIDHLLPFLYFLNENKDFEYTAKGFIFDTRSNYLKNNDPRIKFLLNYKNVELVFLYKENILEKVKKIFSPKSGSIVINFLSRVIAKISSHLFQSRKINIDWSKQLGKEFLNSKIPLIFTLHKDHITLGIVSEIKKQNSRAKCIVLPHGTTICENRMVLESDLEKDEIIKNDELYNKVDFLLRTSQFDIETAILNGLKKSKGFVIGSPRYCKEWINLKSDLKLDGKEVEIKNNSKIRILFLVPKKQINVFSEELVRTIDFLSSYPEFEIVLLNNNLYYPKIPKEILNRTNIKNYLISEKYSTSRLIDWSEIIFHAGTGVIFEAFIKNKIIVLPRYLTCNTLISDKYNAGFNLRNRDELRTFCNRAVTSLNNLKKTYSDEHEVGNKKFIDDFIYGNSESVPQNIKKTMSSIIENFHN